MLNRDYRDILRALSEEDAEFILVGAYALAMHGILRATLDIDLWVRPTRENAAAVMRALERFGSPLHDLQLIDLQQDDTVFQIGVAPRRIDIITGVTALTFGKAYANALSAEIEGVNVRVLSIDDLIANKRSTGRTKDLADAEALEAIRAMQLPEGSS